MPVNPLAVFVKPWKEMALPALGAHIQQLGFAWVELPVRPGFPCRPATIAQDLPNAVKVLGDHGVQILNVTAALPLDDERLYAACAAAGVGMNRVMFRTEGKPYWEAEAAARQQLDAALPLCEKYNVQIGIQNHYGTYVGVHAFGLYHLVQEYDPKYVGIIWDAAHNALEGMAPELALDVVASHLCCVNLKNGYWRRVNGPEAEIAEWKVHWTSGRHGRASWPTVVEKLKTMDYTGPICLTAEYSDEAAVDRLIAEDLAFAQSLLR
ncbi:MAG: sugar phosphate isomerase/epimerase [Caldilineaceae bacterium]|nr:sugar phosphate isomerase/epimerase [Caldilineaceae bacterium]